MCSASPPRCGIRAREAEIRIGCSGWNYAHWRNGVFYPPRLPAAKWLDFYAERFDTVEVNATFYRLPKREAVANWVEQSPPGFLFAVKGSRYLTHIKRLLDLARASTASTSGSSRSSVRRSSGRCSGSCRRPSIATTSAWRRHSTRLPPGRHCFEFRHESWFVDEIYELLRSHGVALVIGDRPSGRSRRTS